MVAPRLVRLATDALKAASALSPAHEVLREVAHAVTGTCSLAILQGGEVAYIDSAVADSPLMLNFQTGQRAPLYCTSSGKVFLASMDKKMLDRYLATGPWNGITRRTIVEPRRLREEIERTREREYAMTESEFVEGVVGAAVPVSGPAGHPLAALTVSVPEARQTLEDLKRLIPLLQRSAAKLSRILLPT
jgi:DNA-binding IclR family transcriptional regulator